MPIIVINLKVTISKVSNLRLHLISFWIDFFFPLFWRQHLFRIAIYWRQDMFRIAVFWRCNMFLDCHFLAPTSTRNLRFFVNLRVNLNSIWILTTIFLLRRLSFIIYQKIFLYLRIPLNRKIYFLSNLSSMFLYSDQEVGNLIIFSVI